MRSLLRGSLDFLGQVDWSWINWLLFVWIVKGLSLVLWVGRHLRHSLHRYHLLIHELARVTHLWSELLLMHLILREPRLLYLHLHLGVRLSHLLVVVVEARVYLAWLWYHLLLKPRWQCLLLLYLLSAMRSMIAV